MIDTIIVQRNTVFKLEDLVRHLKILQELRSLAKLKHQKAPMFNFDECFEEII